MEVLILFSAWLSFIPIINLVWTSFRPVLVLVYSRVVVVSGSVLIKPGYVKTQFSPDFGPD